MKNIVVLLIAIFLCFNYAKAKQLHINPNGSNQKGKGTVEYPWQTIAHALSKAKPGDTIVMSAGEFVENEILFLNDVSLIGAGAGKTTIKINHFYNIEDGTPAPSPTKFGDMYDSMPEESVIQANGKNMVLKGFSMDGQNHKCHVAIRGIILENVVFDDLNIFNFNFTALYLLRTLNVEIKNCTLTDNAWGNTVRAFGNIIYCNGNNLSIHDNTIIQKRKGAYGMCAYDQRRRAFFGKHPALKSREIEGSGDRLLENVKIYNNHIEVPEKGSWNNFMAPGISIETNGIFILNFEVYNNWTNNHISITPINKGEELTNMKRSCHIHHNIIDMGLTGEYRYAIEANSPGMEINNNLIIGGLYPIAQWQRGRGEYFDYHNIHHNVFYGTRGGHELVRYAQYPTNFKFNNNVVIETNEKPITQYIFKRKNHPLDVKGAEVCDNIFLSMNNHTDSVKWVFGEEYTHLKVNNNQFYNNATFGENAKVLSSEEALKYTLDKMVKAQSICVGFSSDDYE